jgi:hypothetical protein
MNDQPNDSSRLIAEMLAALKEAHRAIGGEYIPGVQSRIRAASDKAEAVAPFVSTIRAAVLEEAARECERVAVLRGEDDRPACEDCAHSIRAMIPSEKRMRNLPTNGRAKA